MKNKELTINKPSAMIQTNAKGLTLTQRKIINILIKNAQSAENSIEYTIPLKTIKNLCGISSQGNGELKEHILRLQKIIIVFNYLGKDNKNIWDSNVLLPAVKINRNSGLVKYEFTSFIRKQIVSPSMYAPLNVLLISSFKSKHTIILYEFLRDYLYSPVIPKLSINGFKDIMGIEDGKYNKFKDFRKYVLDRAVDEINDKSELTCSYELIKELGNKYSHIKFKVKGEAKLKQIEENNLIPDVIINSLPEKYQTETVLKEIRKYCIEPIDVKFIISNIKYSLERSKKNFFVYLKRALEEDFTEKEREEKEKTEQQKENLKQKQFKQEQERLEKKRVEEELEKQGQNLYNALTEDELEKYTKIVKTEMEKQDMPTRYMIKPLIKAEIVKILLEEQESD